MHTPHCIRRVSNRKQKTLLAYATLERRELLACIQVGGEITVDTVWNSPDGYCLDEKLTITNDATLELDGTTISRLDPNFATSAENFIDIQNGNIVAVRTLFDGALPKIVVGVDSSFNATNSEFTSVTRMSIDVFGQIDVAHSTLRSAFPTKDVHLHPSSSGEFNQNILEGEFIIESNLVFHANRFQGRISYPADSIVDFLDRNSFINNSFVTIVGDFTQDLTIDTASSTTFIVGDSEIVPGITLTVKDEVILRFAGEIRVSGSLHLTTSSLLNLGSGRLTILDGGHVEITNGSTTDLGLIEVLAGGTLVATDSVLNGDFVISGQAELIGNEFTSFGSLQLGDGGSGSISMNSISMPMKVDSNSHVTFAQNFIDSSDVRTSGELTQTVDLADNFWNTTNLEDIAARITDQKDDPSLPAAVFEPILSESPFRLDFVGTDSDDSIGVRLHRGSVGDRFDLYINGTEYVRQNLSKYTQMNFDGGGGVNTIQVSLQRTETHADVSPFTASILNGTLPIEIGEFRWINIHGATRENSTLQLAGSPDDDTLSTGLGGLTLRSENYANQVSGFGTYLVNANQGGFDKAIIEARETDTRFVFRDDRLAILDAEYQSSAAGFDSYSLRGTLNNHNNKITYWGTSGDDTFTSGNEKSTFETPEVFIEAELFVNATARGNGGFDVARVADTPLNDNLFARLGQVFLSNENGIVANVFDFDNVTVISTETDSGFDSATLVGSELAERFSGNSTFSELKNGDSFVRAYRFSKVTAQSGGGADEAFLYDSAGNDTFVASPNYNAIFGGDYRVGAIGFPKVTGVSNSGFDVAHFTDSAGDDVLFTTPVFSRLTNATTERLAIGFDQVYANSSSGTDQAIFRDSMGDDVFVAKPNSALINGDGYRNFAVGFASTFATSTGGDDIARFVDSAGNDSLFMDSAGTRLKGNGFNNFATGFGRNLVFSIGGDDFAFIVDTEENDFLGGSNDDLWMFNTDYYRFIHGFETIQAGAINGGTNRANVDVAFELELFGDWIV